MLSVIRHGFWLPPAAAKAHWITLQVAWALKRDTLPSVHEVPGPADLGVGSWPQMTFKALDDPAQRAAAEFVQEVVREVESRLVPRREVQRTPGLNRRELARRAGIGEDSLVEVLHGRVWPRSDRLIRIAQAAGVTVGVL
jgi:hypothetical protein